MLISVIATIATFVIAFFMWSWIRQTSTFFDCINSIPGPPVVPIVGNLLDIPRNGVDLLKTLDIEWVEKYGKIYRFWQGLHPAVSLSSPEDMEVMLANKKNINKSFTGDFLMPWLGEGLLLSKGEKWKKDRRLLTPAFHFQILDDFFDVFNRNALIFVDQIKKKLSASTEIDIFPMAGRCTLDVICEAAMGIQINAQLHENSEYLGAIHRILSSIQERICSYRILLPDWVYFLTTHGKTFQLHLDTIHNFAKSVIKKRKAEFKYEKGNETSGHENVKKRKRQAFLDLLLQAVNEGADLSEEDILYQVHTFMFGGHDTTSAAITWFLYCMAVNPEEQDRVFREIYECFGDSDRPCSLEDLPNLKYLDCCIKESMRLYPSVPMIRRRIDEEIQLSGYRIPVGTSISVQIYALHHNENVFPDHLAFKPERFSPDNCAGRHPFAFLPFSAGPRNCIGQKFAMYENKVILCWLLRNFRFGIDDRRVPIQPSRTIILKPEGGMPLIISPRS